MQKRGGRGRRSSPDTSRYSRSFSGAKPERFVPRPVKRRALGAVDLIAIIVVIAALSATLGALVALRTGRGLDLPGWVERLGDELISLAPHSEAEASSPSPAQSRR